MSSLRMTPLFSWHEAHGFIPMDCMGWVMPRCYTAGAAAEHLHTREKAGLFDRCHMGQLLLEGKGATEALGTVVAANMTTLKPGRCRYGFVLNEQGGIEDDLIIYRLGQESFMLVVKPNCMVDKYREAFLGCVPSLHFEDISRATAKIDLQGPLSFEVLSRVIPGPWGRLPFYGFTKFTWQGVPLMVSRTGYTGELGVEIYAPWEQAEPLWLALVAEKPVMAAGIEARETLRMEAGLPLYGQELDEWHTPAEAGFASMLTSHAEYIGKEQAHRLDERLTALILEGETPAARGAEVHTPSGEKAGNVTTSVYAPSLGKVIALAYIRTEFLHDDCAYTVDCADAKAAAKAVTLPFYAEGTARDLLF